MRGSDDEKPYNDDVSVNKAPKRKPGRKLTKNYNSKGKDSLTICPSRVKEQAKTSRINKLARKISPTNLLTTA